MLPLQVFLPLISHTSREYKTMQPDLTSKNQKDSMSHRFSNNYTGFRFKHALTTNLQHLLFDTLMVLCLSISLQGWIYISRPDRSDQAMTGFSGFHVGNWNLSGTGLSATKDLSFGTLFPLISNSHLPCPPLSPDWKHICSRSPIHYAEITVTDVTGHTAMMKRM